MMGVGLRRYSDEENTLTILERRFHNRAIDKILSNRPPAYCGTYVMATLLFINSAHRSSPSPSVGRHSLV